ncbi:MAG TPA: C-type lectin domain-containing protein [Verrucomicrobiae bacterium]|jgi:hypothetical protein
MKTATVLCSSGFTLLFSIFHATGGIVAGPITNPENGHDYYLLASNTWSASEVEAENLGGTLAVINSAAEQKWLYSTIGSYGGTNHGHLWIGLHRQGPSGPFSWVTDERVGYTYWATNQPDNRDGRETAVEMWADDHGYWNDTVDSLFREGIVEVPGTSNEKSLSKTEHSLIGTWYEAGRTNQLRYIAGTENKLFAINSHGRCGRIISDADSIFVIDWKMHAQIVDERILWSDGTWWSRKPSKYESSSDGNGPIQSPRRRAIANADAP